MRVGASVVDAHDHGLAGLRVGDLDLGAEGQRLVGGRHVIGVEPLAIGGELAMKAEVVPRGLTALEACLFNGVGGVAARLCLSDGAASNGSDLGQKNGAGKRLR